MDLDNRALQHGVYPYSLRSLFLETFFDDTPIGVGTGFVVSVARRTFLVSCHHVLAGKRPGTVRRAPTAPSRGVPSRVVIHYHRRGGFGTYVEASEELFSRDGGRDLLVSENRDVAGDVALLELHPPDEAALAPVDMAWADQDMRVWPSMGVSVVGFPFGLSSFNKLPIWKTAHVASEVEIDAFELPCFLVDASTRDGMSGSPVLAIHSSFHRLSGSYYTSPDLHVRFLGVYSGRIEVPKAALQGVPTALRPLVATVGTDIGMVWKPSVIHHLIEQAGAAVAS